MISSGSTRGCSNVAANFLPASSIILDEMSLLDLSLLLKDPPSFNCCVNSLTKVLLLRLSSSIPSLRAAS